MPNLTEHVAQLDSLLHNHKQESAWTGVERRRVRDSIQAIASISPNSDLTLVQTIHLSLTKCPSEVKRTLAAVMIRLISSTGPLTADDVQKCRREIVKFVEEATPNLTKGIFNPNHQNHEKIEALAQVHHTACEHLQPLLNPFASLQDLGKRRQTLMQSIKHSRSKSYLGAFGYNSVLQLVESLLAQVETVVQAQGHELLSKMQQLIEDIPDHKEHCVKTGTFVTSAYILPFLNRLETAATIMQDHLASTFECRISVPDAAQTTEKRFPLHLVGSSIEIFVPLNNEGPRIAQNVTTYCVSDHGTVRNPESHLGAVDPGPFVLAFLIGLTEPQQELQVTVEVTWSVVGDPKPHSETFTTVVEGQRTDIDWEEMALKHPYSLEVVYDEDFYGRKDVLNRIIRRLTSNAMQSCYITGQKRVGKSSLARAVQSMIEQMNDSASYHVLYLECGEIRHATGEQTLAQLGEQLEDYLTDFLSRRTDWTKRDYSSSLSPLNGLSDSLYKESGLSRFIIILDEFDEINEPLYSHGELASTFFLNLRTLASRKNLAFVLVGAEKMPHLMSAQGEKLNKFDGESLNSFNQETEWADFSSLVRDPLGKSIFFHDGALRRIYDLTDGHPYFTKALCSKVYELAVHAKDAEVSRVDIDKAAQRLLVSLDTNAFAHYWRDGTRGGADDVEIASVKRCRTLVSWARTVRSGAKPSREEIERRLHSHLRADEMRRELDDFCRRAVFTEMGGQYFPKVELFGRWLLDGGFARLVDGNLGDELEDKRKLEEDAAYVKAEEIVELVQRWPHYQGTKLTEDRVRAWVDQVETNVSRRQLFKLLQNVRFVTDGEVQEAFRGAYENFRNRLPVIVQRRRGQRRDDVIVTFLGGAAKSGQHFANLFAQANRITQTNVIAPERMERRLKDAQNGGTAAIVVVDDMIGTGASLTGELDSNSDMLEASGVGSHVPLFVCVFCATEEGEARARRHLERKFDDSELYTCEMLERRHYAFCDGLAFWDSTWQMEKAKTMALELGARIDKRRPLGYSDQGLLLTFSRNWPNNSLPILFGHGKGSSRWSPIFPRLQL